MKTAQYRLLRVAIIAMGTAYSAIFLLRLFFPGVENTFGFQTWVMLIRGIILMAIGMTIAIKLPRETEKIFFALFLVNFAMTSWTRLFPDFPWPVEVLIWALTSGGFVYAMIAYPGSSAVNLYHRHFDSKPHPVWYREAVLFFTTPKNFWLIFFPLLLVLRGAGHFLAESFFDVLNILVNLSGLIYFKISYSLTGKTDRSRLAWILWGAVVALVITLVELLLRILYPEAHHTFFEATFLLTSLTICLSIAMGVFFSGFLDTALVLRGTIVYSALFLSVVFLFSFVEYFVEHGLEAFFHIENDLLSAFLAGVLALAVQPLHKKLEKILPKF